MDKRKLRILVFPPNQGGCAQARAITPFNKLNELYSDRVEIRFTENPLSHAVSSPGQENFEGIEWADIIFISNICNYGARYLARVVGIAKEYHKIVHFDQDDLLVKLYEGHKLYDVYEKGGLSEIVKWLCGHCDLLSFTQEKFAEYMKQYAGKNTRIAVIRNALDYNLESWNKPRIDSKKVRVAYFAGGHHLLDIAEIKGVPHMVNQKVGINNVDWILIGYADNDPIIKDTWKTYIQRFTFGMKGKKNVHIIPALPFDKYGALYSQVDLSIAPLQMNDFNNSKSDIKIAECSRYEVPLIASNVGAYDQIIKNGRNGYLIENSEGKSRWIKVLSTLIKDSSKIKQMGRQLKEDVGDLYDLNLQVGKRLDLYEDLFKEIGDPRDND